MIQIDFLKFHIFAMLTTFVLIAILIGVSIVENSNTDYKMPDGVICKSDTITGGGFGGATHEFSKCSNGKVYINPETYLEVKEK